LRRWIETVARERTSARDRHRTSIGAQALRVILAKFHANGLLMAAGERLAAEHGLTAARWQVLG
jgi:hypothetical protein